MLVLTRKVGEQIQIGDHVVVTVLRLQGGAVRLGVEADDRTRILRRELDCGEPLVAENPQPSVVGAARA